MPNQILPGVWTIESELRLLPGVKLPLRSIILRDSEGGLTLVSPVRGVQEWGGKVDELGEVTHVVAPSGFHHLFALPAHERFPNAQLSASAALKKKRPDFPEQTHWLAGAEPLQLAPGIIAYPLCGMPGLQEWAFFHEPSATLVVIDLLFNVLTPSFSLGIFQRGFGTYKKLGVSRLFMSACKDSEALAASVRRLLALPFENLVMAHGEPLLEDAKDRTRAALSQRISL